MPNNKIESGKIAIVIMGMPYKCPPAPFEASLLVDSMLRNRGIRDSVEIDFYSPAPITLPAAGPEVSKQILDLVNSEKIIFHNSQNLRLHQTLCLDQILLFSQKLFWSMNI